MGIAILLNFNLVSMKAEMAARFFQGEPVRFNLLSMWEHMGWPARAIAIVLLLMSIWSIGIMTDR